MYYAGAMLKNIEITKKFPLVMITFALISALITGVIAYSKTYASMDAAAKEKLKSLLDSRKSSLNQYFDNVAHQVTFQADNPLVIEALASFDNNFKVLESEPSKLLQKLYIDQNPFARKQRRAYRAATDNSLYTQTHRKYQPLMKNIIETNAYYDLFLINSTGDLVYSVIKERDYATNLINGKWKDTNLAQLFRDINDTRKMSDIKIADFQPYAPSDQKPASFIGTSVFDHQSNYLGAIIFQLPTEPIDNIMQVTAGMGNSGETYLVGPDYLMRSNSRFYKNSSILKIQVKTQPSIDSLAGKSGLIVSDDYRGVSVYSAFAPINALSLNWGILAEIDEAEVLEPVYDMSQFLLISGILITAVIFTVGYLLSSDISQPIVAMTKMMNKLSKNDLAFDICVEERDDEVGEMAKAMVVFKKHAIEREKLKDELHNIANVDSLTGLYSRKFAMENLILLMKNATEKNNKVVLMFIDLDNFKQVNDTYGHHTGDQTLCSISQHLSACVRKNDIVSRIGGDEFLISFPNIESVTDISNIATHILNTFPENPYGISLSIGLSVYPDDARDPDALVQYADEAMYKVKQQGKNNFSYWNPNTQLSCVT